MIFLINDQIDTIKWHKLLSTSDFASPFQTPDYYAFYNSIKGFSADVLAIEQNGSISALMVVTLQKEKGLKGFFSRRGIIYGGPLLINKQDDYVSFLFSKAKEYYRSKAIYLEVRNFFDYRFALDKLASSSWQYIDYGNFLINIHKRSIEDVLSAMKYNRRREIRQSLSEGIEYSLCTDLEDLYKLYEILFDLYTNKVKLPIPDFSFFQSFFQMGFSKIFIVKHRAKVIGGSVCAYLPGENLYTLYYCGLRDYHKKIFPAHIAVVAAIEYGIQKGIRVVDLMGAGKPNEEYGVRKYKAQFGGDYVEHGRFLCILNPLLYKIGSLGIKLLSKIK